MDKGTPSQSKIGGVAAAVALISASVLTFEIVLTRIFSVMLSYHFVFAVVSFALLGLGIGGMLRQSWSERFPGLGFSEQAALLAVAMALSVVGIVRLPIYNSDLLAGLRLWIYLGMATVYKNHTYLLCCPVCQAEFEKQPEKYVINSKK